MGLKEYLDNYVFSYDSIYEDPGILQEDWELHEIANEIAEEFYGPFGSILRDRRTIGVGRIKDSTQKVVASSCGDFTGDERRTLEARGYIVLSGDRGSGIEDHAEKRLIREQLGIEAIGVSHKKGICSSCWAVMQEADVRRASLLHLTK
jgi:hypothetical protein